MTTKTKTTIPKLNEADEKGDMVTKVNSNFLNYLQAQVTTNTNSLREYIHVIRMFEEYLQRKQKSPKHLTQNEIDGFIVELKTMYKTNSMIPKTAGLRHYVRHLGFNPEKGGNIKIEMPTTQHTRMEEVLTEEEVRQLFDATEDNPLSNAVIKTLYYTALRRNELINLNIKDIDSENRKVLVRNGKGVAGQPQKVTISDIALESIQRYLNVRQTPREGYEDALFLCSTKTRINNTSVMMMLREAGFKAGIKRKVYPHILRSSHITHRHNMGADILTIQEESRHKSLDSLKVYIRTSDEERTKNYDRYTPKIYDSNKQDIPIPPIPPEKPEKPKVNISETTDINTRKAELKSLLKEGIITMNTYLDEVTKQDTLMFG